MKYRIAMHKIYRETEEFTVFFLFNFHCIMTYQITVLDLHYRVSTYGITYVVECWRNESISFYVEYKYLT